MTQIIDREGLAQQVDLKIEDYRAAFDAGMTLPQYLNNKYQTDETQYGTAFEQAMASNGMFLNADKKYGIKPPTIRAILDGNVDINMGAITRPDGNNAQTLSGRLLFPAAILELVESQLAVDNGAYESVFNQLVAMNTSVDSPRFDQPIINLTAPRAVRSQPISQLSEPPAMVSITLSEKSQRLPTHSIGLEISDEASRASTLDLVGIALREQATAERAARIDEALIKMIAGDTDLGLTALTSANAHDFDSAATSAAAFSQKAFLKYLRADWKKLNIDWIICDLDGYLAMENRTGKPIWTGNEGTDGRLNSIMQAANPGIPGQINYFIVDPVVLGSANNSTASGKIVGLDSTRAIRKVTFSGAAYSAIENFVLRRASALRIDFSEGYFRLFDEAWKPLLLS